MRVGQGHPPEASRLECRLRPGGGQALVEDAKRELHLVGRRDERRDDPGDVGVGPGRQDDEPSLEGLGQDPLRELRVGDAPIADRRA